VFSLTNTDYPDPVPATYRIYYDLCVINEGDVPLTNAVLVDSWSPLRCVYLPPDNPSKVWWAIGTIAPHTQYCVQLILNTYSVCAGSTVTNEAVLTCDQGSTRAVATTRIGPTPIPSVTSTVTPTLTLTPTLAQY